MKMYRPPWGSLLDWRHRWRKERRIIRQHQRMKSVDTKPFQKLYIQALKFPWLTKQKQRLSFLFSKLRRRLYRLRLKFEETTRVVCTDYSWSLQKVLRTYKFNYVYSLKCLRVLIIISAHTHDNEYVVLIETIMVKHKKWGYAIPAQPPPKKTSYTIRLVEASACSLTRTRSQVIVRKVWTNLIPRLT